MKRGELISKSNFPKPIFNLDFGNATYNRITDTVSGNSITSNSTSSTIGFVEDELCGRGMKFLSKTSNNVFSGSMQNFPLLSDLLKNNTASISMVVIGNFEGLMDTSSRWGFLSTTNTTYQLSMWNNGKNPSFCFWGWGNYSIGPAYGLNHNGFQLSGTDSRIWYKGIDSTHTEYINSTTSQLLTNANFYRCNGSSTTNLQFGQFVESYLVPSGAVFNSIAIYDRLLTQEELNQIIENGKVS